MCPRRNSRPKYGRISGPRNTTKQEMSCGCERDLVLHAAGGAAARRFHVRIAPRHFGGKKLRRHVMEGTMQHLVFHEGATALVISLKQRIGAAVEIERRDAEAAAQRRIECGACLDPTVAEQ